MTKELPEAGGGVSVYVWIPKAGGLDQGPQLVGVSPELRLHPGCRSPFGQLPKPVGRYVVLAPEGEAGYVGSADHVAEVGQPQGEREVLRVGHVRPDALHS